MAPGGSLVRIRAAQDFATDNGGPIADSTAISLTNITIRIFEKATLLYHDRTVAWRNQDNTASTTMTSLQLHFARADKERHCNSTVRLPWCSVLTPLPARRLR
jgi:hypothetical protein